MKAQVRIKVVLSIAMLATTSLAQAQTKPCAPPTLSVDGGSTVQTSCELTAPGGTGTDYRVGPGQAYTNIGDVPWYRLKAGDTVYIHHRSSPYREKFLISARGTAAAWIRVLGVPGPNGELPVISGDGATTSSNMRYRWQDPRLVQWLGIVQIAARADEDGSAPPVPAYIEIANLQIQDGYKSYRFTAENGTQLTYDGFAACIYARSVQHLLVRNNVLTNCGQGFYNWTGDGSADAWWAGLQTDTVLRGNHFYNNGHANSYTEHQVYTESDGVVIEHNRFGPQRSGSLGSQLKDRSAGTVIRYNYIEQSPAGWNIDLVEPEESAPSLLPKETYKQAFVYGNVIVSAGNSYRNMIHWNEDHGLNRGRATVSGGKLFFYHNTIVVVANQSETSVVTLFNSTAGGYECPDGTLRGVIDVRNNIVAMIPRTAGSAPPQLRFAYCGQENFHFGWNWVSPGFTINGALVTGSTDVVSPVNNAVGFVDVAGADYHLSPGSSAVAIGTSLASEVTANSLNLDLTPTQQYVYHQQTQVRSRSGTGSDAGALGR